MSLDLDVFTVPLIDSNSSINFAVQTESANDGTHLCRVANLIEPRTYACDEQFAATGMSAVLCRFVCLVALASALAILPLAIPLTGTFFAPPVPGDKPHLSFPALVGWLAYDDVLSWILGFSYFFFTTPRFPTRMYILTFGLSMSACLLFCLLLGTRGLQGSMYLSVYSHSWTIAIVLVVQTGGAWYYAAWRPYAASLGNFCLILGTLFFSDFLPQWLPLSGSLHLTLVLFVLVCLVLRAGSNMLGRVTMSHSGFCAQSNYLFVQHCLYFSFYRQLFLHLDHASSLQFAMVLLVNVAQDIFFFALLVHPSVYHVQRILRMTLKRYCCAWLPGTAPQTYAHWFAVVNDPQAFDADWTLHVYETQREYVVRLLAMTTSGINFAVFFAILYHTAYFAMHFPRLTAGQDGNDLVLKTLVSLAVEWLVAVGMSVYMRRYQSMGLVKGGVWETWSELSGHKGQFCLFALMAAHILMDVYLPALSVSF
jgi:hypothetical protein